MQGDFGVGRLTLLIISAALVVATGSRTLHAQSVTLRSSDGSVTISGPLLNFDGTTYTIKRGSSGELSLPVSEFSCVSGPCPDPTGFGIHGSNTIGAELMPRLIEGYAKSLGAHGRIANSEDAEVAEITVTRDNGTKLAAIDLQAHGSGTATPGLVSRKALIGMASRPLNAGELEQLGQQGFGDMRSPEHEHVVGLDGIVVIVSPQNSITKLSLQQLQGIFSGGISDWSQVGATAGRINVYARDSKSGTFDTFKALVLDPGKQKIADDARRLESSNDLADLVTNDPAGIGFIGFAYVRNAKPVSLVNECGMSFAPSTFGVKTEEYPLSRRLFLYTGMLPQTSFAAGLLEFSMSSSGQSIVRESGFIGQELEIQHNNQSGRISDVTWAGNPQGANRKSSIASAHSAEETYRTSVTMRFRFNSTELDNKALNDLNTLAEFLQFMRETKRERTLVLAGFADSVGAVEKNIAISLDRANAVRQALLGKLGDPQYAKHIEARGYGSALAVACNESELGRDKNRRVEIWLK